MKGDYLIGVATYALVNAYSRPVIDAKISDSAIKTYLKGTLL